MQILQKAKSFDQYAKLARAGQHAITPEEGKAVEKRFDVSPAEVQGLRDDLLDDTAASTDQVGQQTKALRDQSRGGTFKGQTSVKGLGLHAARFGLAPSDGPQKLPDGLDVTTLKPVWAVNLGNDKTASATAHFEAAGGFQLHLDLGYKGENQGRARVGVVTPDMLKQDSFTIQMDDLNPALATDLAVALDHVLAKYPASNAFSGPGYAMKVAEHLADSCVAAAIITAPPLKEQQAAVKDAAVRFDGGAYDDARADLQTLAKSPHPAVRGHANMMLAETSERLGRYDEALESLALAEVNLPEGTRFFTQQQAGRCHRAQADWPACTEDFQAAVKLGESLREGGAKLDLSSAYFGLAVAQKNTGKIGDAVNAMQQAVTEKPDSTAFQLALSGYLSLAGDEPGAKKVFEAVDVPPPGEFAHLDYQTNSTWLAGLTGDADAVLERGRAALEAAKALNYPATVHYLETETDLTFMHDDPRFMAMLDEFRS